MEEAQTRKGHGQVLGYLTFKDTNEAKTLCRQLVDKKLIACANIFPAHTAIYSWQGQTEEGTEVATLIKTQTSKTSAIESFLKEQHSYDTPCFVTWSLDGGSQDFLNWINQQTEKL